MKVIAENDVKEATEGTAENHAQTIIVQQEDLPLVSIQGGHEHQSPDRTTLQQHQAGERRGQDFAEQNLLSLQEIMMSDTVDESVEFTPGLFSPDGCSHV